VIPANGFTVAQERQEDAEVARLEQEPDFTLTDGDGNPLHVGTRVVPWDAKGVGVIGTVTDLGEWDGDYSDEMERAVAIPPRITVEWDDGRRDSFESSEWEWPTRFHDYTGGTGVVDDVTVVA
jgi:hypothetical protein